MAKREVAKAPSGSLTLVRGRLLEGQTLPDAMDELRARVEECDVSGSYWNRGASSSVPRRHLDQGGGGMVDAAELARKREREKREAERNDLNDATRRQGSGEGSGGGGGGRSTGGRVGLMSRSAVAGGQGERNWWEIGGVATEGVYNETGGREEGRSSTKGGGGDARDRTDEGSERGDGGCEGGGNVEEDGDGDGNGDGDETEVQFKINQAIAEYKAAAEEWEAAQSKLMQLQAAFAAAAETGELPPGVEVDGEGGVNSGKEEMSRGALGGETGKGER